MNRGVSFIRIRGENLLFCPSSLNFLGSTELDRQRRINKIETGSQQTLVCGLAPPWELLEQTLEKKRRKAKKGMRGGGNRLLLTRREQAAKRQINGECPQAAGSCVSNVASWMSVAA